MSALESYGQCTYGSIQSSDHDTFAGSGTSSDTFRSLESSEHDIEPKNARLSSLKAIKASSKSTKKYPEFSLIHRVCRLLIKNRQVENALKGTSLNIKLHTLQVFLKELLSAAYPSSPIERFFSLREILHPSVEMTSPLLTEQKICGFLAVSAALSSICTLLGVYSTVQDSVPLPLIVLDIDKAFYNDAGTKISVGFTSDAGMVALNGTVCGVFADDLLISIHLLIQKV